MTSILLPRPVTLRLYLAIKSGPRGEVTHAVAPSGAKGLEERRGRGEEKKIIKSQSKERTSREQEKLKMRA